MLPIITFWGDDCFHESFMKVKNRCHFNPSNCSLKLDGESSKSDLEICVFIHTDVPNRMFQFERYFHYIEWMTY